MVKASENLDPLMKRLQQALEAVELLIYGTFCLRCFPKHRG